MSKISLKQILKNVLCRLPIKRYIVFESVPDFTDNSKAVYDEMLRRGLNKKYKCIWLVSDRRKIYPKHENTWYVDTCNGLGRVMLYYYMVRAKCLICCNKFLYTDNKKQKSFFLTHGTAIKSVHEYYNVPDGIDYILIASEGTKEMMSYELNGNINKFIPLGFPRNDVLQSVGRNLHDYFGEKFDKIIAWYPTFRQHKSGNTAGGEHTIPIIHAEEQAFEVNRIAAENKVLLVVKPHFAQDTSYIKRLGLSNIAFIDDSFFENKDISSYEFIGSCDALITDYSSVYYDFLLCDKPIAMVWEDYEEYRMNPGFAYDMSFCAKGAEKIYDVNDMVGFISLVAKGEDRLCQERREIKNWANFADDGKNSARVVEFIIEKAEL